MTDRPTDYQPDPQPETEIVTDLSLAEAAELIGSTTNAVYLRVKRGSLPGYKGPDGKWYIRKEDLLAGDVVEPEPEPAPDGHDQPGEDAEPASRRPQPGPRQQTLIPVYQQLEMIRDEWLQPLINQITEQATEIGGLKATLEIREAELARLSEESAAVRAEIERLQATASSQDTEMQMLRAQLEEAMAKESESEEVEVPPEPAPRRSWLDRLLMR